MIEALSTYSTGKPVLTSLSVEFPSKRRPFLLTWEVDDHEMGYGFML